jgi:uncharacterized protein YxeA
MRKALILIISMMVLIVCSGLVTATIDDATCYHNGSMDNATTVTDISGQGNESILTDGAIVGSGYIGDGFTLDGAGAYLAPGFNIGGSTDFTVCLWYDADVTNGDILVAQDKNDWYIYQNTDRIEYMISGNSIMSRTGAFQPGWKHVCVTYDNTNMTLYYMGNYENSTARSGATDSGTFYIGKRNDGLSFDGDIDEFALYNRALSSTEVGNLYDTNVAGNNPWSLSNNAPVLNITSPINNDHSNQNLSVTFTPTDLDNDNINCSLYVNDTLKQTIPNIVNGTQHIINGSLMDGDGLYSWQLSCNDGTDTTNSSVYNYTLDTVNPDITWYYPLLDNTSSTVTNFTINITVNDIYLYRVMMNITASNGTNMYGNYSGDLDQMWYNFTDAIDVSGWLGGYYTVEVSATDDHTYGKIKFDKQKVSNERIRFADIEKDLTVDFDLYDASGDIIPNNVKTTIDDVKLTEKLLKDNRKLPKKLNDDFVTEYKFTYDFKIKNDGDYPVITVSSNEFLDYRYKSQYAAHFIWGEENYLDFEDAKFIEINGVRTAAHVEVIYFDGYSAKIKIYPTGGYKKNDLVVIDPVTGGLNTVTEQALIKLNTAVVMNTIRVNPTSPLPGQDLSWYVNASDEDGDNITYDCDLYQNGVIIESIDVVADDDWNNVTSLSTGLNMSNTVPSISVGYNVTGSGTWDLISGSADGNLYGHSWTATGWITNTSVVNGLPDVGTYSKPELVYNFSGGNQWELFVGEATGNINGYYYNGSEWRNNASIIAGLPTDFYNNGQASIEFNITGSNYWEGIFALSGGTYRGYQWVSNSWVRNETIETGIPDVGTYGTSSAIYNFTGLNEWNLFLGPHNIGGIQFYSWNGTSWYENATYVDFIGDLGDRHQPEVQYNITGNNHYNLIVSTDTNNLLYGYEYYSGTNNTYYYENKEINIFNVSATSIDTGDNLTLSCRAYDGTSYSDIRSHSVIIDYQYSLTFRDERNLSILAGINITVEFISDNYTFNFTTTTGTLSASVNFTDYTIRYYSDNYGRKRHYFSATELNNSRYLTLYMLNNSYATDTTVTLYDELTLKSVSNAIVYLERYYQIDNDYKIVAMYETDYSGYAYFDTEHQAEKYRFRVFYPSGTLKLLTDPNYIEEANINLYIDLIGSAYDQFFDEQGITYTVTYDNATESFSVSYNDENAVATSYSLHLKTYGAYSKETIETDTSTSSADTLIVSNLQANKTNYIVFTATIGGSEVTIATGWIDVTDSSLGTGAYGAFITNMIFMVFTFVSSFHILGMILAVSSLLFAKTLGFVTMSWGYIIGLWICTIVLAMIIHRKK